MLQVKLRARLFFKTIHVAILVLLRGSIVKLYNIARLIPLKLVFKFAIVSCTSI